MSKSGSKKMTAASIKKPRIGVLALTLELYETLSPGVRAGREKWLRKGALPNLAEFADVRFDRAAFRAEDVREIVSAYEADGIEGLLVVCLTYSPSQVSLPALARTRLPILVWNTQELSGVDESFSGPDMTNNHGVHGTQDLANVLLRSGVPFEYVTSRPADEQGLAQLRDWAAAAGAVAGLRKVRLGLLGYPFPGMGDFGLDTTHLATTLGCQWEALSVSEYVRRASQASAKAVARLVADYRAAYDVAADVTGRDLAAAARAELALRGMVRDYRLDAYSYQFLAFGQDERVETLPFLAASRLLADGIGFGGEGDLISAAHCALVGWLNPPASFSEIFTIDFAGNAVLVSHMGEANVAMARRGGKVRLVRRSRSLVPIRGKQLSLACAFQPGPATLSALTLSAGQRWRIIAAPMLIEDFGPLPQLAVPHSKLRPGGDVRDFLNAYATAGGPHHLVICFGDAGERLRLSAAFLGAEYVEV
jgi:L-arabinose isomerase